jgi:hypothetical protein
VTNDVVKRAMTNDILKRAAEAAGLNQAKTPTTELECPHCANSMHFIRTMWICQTCGSAVKFEKVKQKWLMVDVGAPGPPPAIPQPGGATGQSLALPVNTEALLVPLDPSKPVEIPGPKIALEEECDCGGPAGHVPNGILCRRKP